MKTKRQVLPLILLLVCILAVSLFYGAQKSGMFIDEVYTFGLSNGYYTPFITDLLEADPILTRQEMTDYLTVSDGDAFCFGSVWYNQTQDVHPPLHYLLIHGISSLFPGSYSKWIGVIPNILLLLAALAWVLLGAPLLPAEWQDVPHRLAITARQLPGRLANLFALWLE